MTEAGSVEYLQNKYSYIINHITAKGCYIWGTGRLGKFAKEQCDKNKINVKGFVDGFSEEGSEYSPLKLSSTDIVIIASFYYPDIIEKLNELGVRHYIYYEELALAGIGFDIYYDAFKEIFGEFERNQKSYQMVNTALSDEVSKTVYEKILKFRETLDYTYTEEAMQLSLAQGMQDLDNVVLRCLNEEYAFFDCGGFDGQSTIDFINSVNSYKKIYFFEPDEKIFNESKNRLSIYKNIEYIQAGVGEKVSELRYDDIGNGGGRISEEGNKIIKNLPLDIYKYEKKAYIKMDIEGAEMNALCGAEQMIKENHPILSVSIYHKVGDIHRLIEKVLSLYPDYKVYMRHYSKTYADTVAYFVP